MSIDRVFFTSRQLAESLAGNPYMAVISITDPGTPPARLDPLFRHVLRLSFHDAVPADDFIPAPGLFDRTMARTVTAFIDELQAAPFKLSLMVHCEFGVSRSAAVALFAATRCGAPLNAREFAYEANAWVLDRLTEQHPGLQVDIPPRGSAAERRTAGRL